MATSSQTPLAKRGLDWIMVSVFASLVIIGWLMLYSANYSEEKVFVFLDFTSEIGKQTLWVIIASVIFIATLALEWNFWNTFAFPLYGVSLVFLLLVLFFGTEINGNKSWFDLGFMSFQPAELAKFGTALALASYMSFNKNNLRNPRVLFTAIAIFTVPSILILLQPDAGSALVFVSFLMLIYRKGLSPVYYIFGFVLIAIFILSLTISSVFILVVSLFLAFAGLLFSYDFSPKTLSVYIFSIVISYLSYHFGYPMGLWIVPLIGVAVGSYLIFAKRNIKLLTFTLLAAGLSIAISFTTTFIFDNVLKPHQKERINIWLRPEKCDPRGPLYNLIQSKLAIGSGGFAGKGYLNGEMTKLNYVPEQSTDFIFSIVGEEQGFLGTFCVIALFLTLIIRSIMIAERAKLEFIRNYAYGVAGILFIHFFVNIGMTMGLMPIIGIPLPLLSKGGTSLLFFSIMISALIKMDASRYRG